MSTNLNVALIGNPNTGKTCLNALTGLNQKVGNYPGSQSKKARKLPFKSHHKSTHY